MTQDNTRLTIIVCGVLSGIIIVMIGLEAIVHDGDIANTIVSTFSWVLGGLVAGITGVPSIAKLVEGKMAGQGIIPPGATIVPPLNDAAIKATPIATPAPVVVEPSSDAAGLAAMAGPGVD